MDEYHRDFKRLERELKKKEEKILELQEVNERLE